VGYAPTRHLHETVSGKQEKTKRMHDALLNKLTINTYLLQFYGYLARGFFSGEELKEIDALIQKNIERIKLMRNDIEWDGQYDLAVNQLFKTETLIKRAKEDLKYEQICSDSDIAEFVQNDKGQFYSKGIQLFELKKLLNLEKLFRNGHMNHDVFLGYQEKHMFQFQIDCLDYLHSAAHFYNEAYDYYNNRKKIHTYDEIDTSKLKPYEMRRIQPREEVIFRNFRESYINLIFFIESFINSVGFDAFLSGVGRDSDDELKLKGIQRINPRNNHPTYSSIKQRIKNFAKIIGGNSVDIEMEPYKSYFEDSVELRNQYVHSSPIKGKILYGINDWKNKCDEMIDNKCHELLKDFWHKCYPNKSFPKVIFNVFHGNSFKGHQGKYMIIE
jgi:hypothetical protein